MQTGWWKSLLAGTFVLSFLLVPLAVPRIALAVSFDDLTSVGRDAISGLSSFFEKLDARGAKSLQKQQKAIEKAILRPASQTPERFSAKQEANISNAVLPLRAVSSLSVLAALPEAVGEKMQNVGQKVGDVTTKILFPWGGFGSTLAPATSPTEEQNVDVRMVDVGSINATAARATKAEADVKALRTIVENLQSKGLKVEAPVSKPTVVERIIERVVQSSAPSVPASVTMVGVSREEFANVISDTRGELSRMIASTAQSGSRQIEYVGRAVASVANFEITDALVPDTITATNYLPLAGGTLTGALTITSGATTTSNAGMNITSGCFSVNNVCITGGGAGANQSPWTSAIDGAGYALSNVGTITATNLIATSTTDNSYVLANFGIGTTSPYANLSVEGLSALGNSATAGYFIATTSTASVLPYSSSTAISVSGVASTSELVVSSHASTTALSATGLIEAGNLLATGSTTLQNMTAVNATTVAATSTASFFTALLTATNSFLASITGTTLTYTTGNITNISSTDATSSNALYVGKTLVVGGNATTSADGNFITNGNITSLGTASSTSLIVSGATTLHGLTDGAGQGQLLYADSSGVITRVASGVNGQVLKMNGTDLSWGADIVGSGGSGGGFFATSSPQDMTIFPLSVDNAFVLGTTATTGNYIFEIGGSGKARIPFASTTALSATGLVEAGNLLATGSTTLQDMTAVNATTVAATSTASFYTALLTATNSFLASITGTNLTYTNGTFTGATSTDMYVGNTLAVGGNATTSASGNIETKGTLTVTGNATLSGGATITCTGCITDTNVVALTGSKVSGNISGNSANVTGTVAVANGGTGFASYTAGDMFYADTATSFARVASSTDGFVLGLYNGKPTWIATTTLATISGTLSVASGGTGANTLTGLIMGNGTSAFTAAVAGVDYLAPNGIASTTQISALDAIYVGRLTATTTIVGDNGTSTFASTLSSASGNLNIQSPGTTNNVTLQRYGGNVGVGATSSPYAKLSVTGSGTSVGTALAVADSSQVPKFTVLNNGKIGFGTEAPQYFGHFYDGVTSATVAIEGPADDVSSAQLYLVEDMSGNGVSDTNNRGALLGWDSANALFTIKTGSNSTYTSRLTVDVYGNVGIGTSSPAKKFSVQGNTFFSGDISNVANITATGTLSLTGKATLSGGASTTNTSLSGSMWIGGNATTTNAGMFSTNGAVLVNNELTVRGGSVNLSVSSSSPLGLYTQNGPDVSGYWTTGSSGGTARYEHASVLYDGKIYSWGGATATGRLDTLDIYDIANDSWSTGAAGGTSRINHTANLYKGKIYFWGGFGSSILNSIDIYDIASNSWTTGTSGGTARQRHVSVVHNGKIYFFGGLNASSNNENILDIYDIASNSWTTGTSGSGKDLASAVLYNDKVYIYGGTTGSNTLDIYDIASNSWSSGTAGGTGKYGHTAIQYGSKMYVLKGYSFGDTNSVSIYDFSTNAWSSGVSGGTNRSYHRSALYNGKIYLWGGATSLSPLNSVEIYNIGDRQSTFVVYDNGGSMLSLKSGSILNLDYGKLSINGGNLGLGTSSPAFKLSVNGKGYFDNSLTANSFTATSTDLVSSFGQVLATGSTTLQNVTAVNATTSAATSTASFYTALLTATNSFLTSITGTNLTYTNGTFTSATSTNATSTNALYVGSTLVVGGNATTSASGNIETKGTLTVTGNATLSGTANSVGTITTGTWQGSLIGSTYGGTGVNNGANTITLGGNITTANAFTTAGNYALTLTQTNTTDVTLPTTGTLSTLAGTESLSNKTLVSPIISGLASVANASTTLLSVTGQFWAGGTGTTTITSAGWVGVGSSTPWGMLSVNPDGISGPAFVVGSSSATSFIVTNGGKVGVGTTSPTYYLSSPSFYSPSVTFAGLVTQRGMVGSESILDTSANIAIRGTSFAGVSSLINPLVNLKNIASLSGGEAIFRKGGTFASPLHTAFASDLTKTIVVDVDGDGDKDVVAIVGTTVHLLLNNGSGVLTDSANYSTVGSGEDITMADFNSDGKPDFAVITSSGGAGVRVLMSDSVGTYTVSAVTTPASGFAISSGDVDSDGLVDIAVTSATTIYLLKNNGNGGFSQLSTLAITGVSTSGLVLGDINGDGKLDIINTNPSNATVGLSVFMGNGDGTFSSASTYTTGTTPRSVLLADMDKDSDLDAVVANYTDGSVSVFLNNGSGIFGAKTDYSGYSYAHQIAAGDYNNDGLVDIAVTAQNRIDVASVWVLLNAGSAILTSGTEYAVDSTMMSVASADMDADGVQDLITTSNNNNRVSVLLNSSSTILYAKASTGRVGIGTANPQTALDILGTASSSNLFIQGSTTLQNVTAVNATTSAATSTASFYTALLTATNSFLTSITGTNLTYTNGTFTDATSTNATSTNALYVGSTLVVGGNATTSASGNIETKGTLTVTGNATLSGTANSVGTITTGTWNGSLVDGTYGGTGVANTGKTITLGGNLTTSGAYALTLTQTNTTDVTLPTTGTLSTLAGTESLSNKTLVSPIISGLASVANASSSLLSVTGQFWAGGTGTTTITSAGWVGVGTSTPYAQLTVWGNSTTTGRSFEITDSASTTLFSIDNSGTTTIANLITGNIEFDSDAGMIQWANMPLSSTTLAANTELGFSAGIGATSTLTVYALAGSDITTADSYFDSVGVGSTSPTAKLAVNGNTTNDTGRLMVLADYAGNERFTFLNNGKLGLGTTSPNWLLSVAGRGSFDDYARASYFTATSTDHVTSLGQLLVNSSTTLQNVTAVNATTSAATSTASFYTALLTATNSFLTSITGTNLTYTNGTFTSATSTNATSTNALYVGGTLVVGGNATTSASGNIETKGTLTVTGTTLLGNVSGTWTSGNITSSNLTATGQATLANASTSLLSVTGQFWAGGTGTTTITSAGWVGIGTSTPYSKLSLWADTVDTGASIFELVDSASTTVFKINDRGRLSLGRIGTTTGAITIDGTNGAYAGNTYGYIYSPDETSFFAGFAAGSTLTTSQYNVGIGPGTLASVASTSDLTMGSYNTATGYGVMNYSTTGSFNSAYGAESMAGDSLEYEADGNSAFGYSTLYSITTGGYNSAFGFNTLTFNTTGYNNAAFGNQALLLNETGAHNVAIGSGALSFNESGSENVAVGSFALDYAGLSGVVNSENTAIGYGAGAANPIWNTGFSSSTFVGYRAVPLMKGLINASAIGYKAEVGSSDSLVLGGTGSYAVNVGIGTSTPVNTLTVIGDSSPQLLLGTNEASTNYWYASSSNEALYIGMFDKNNHNLSEMASIDNSGKISSAWLYVNNGATSTDMYVGSTLVVGGNATTSASGNIETKGTLTVTGNATLSGTANSVGTITTGTWQGSLIGSTYGGTGVNNGANTITLGGNITTANAFTTAGNYALTLTQTNTTDVTLPTTGTLSTLAGTESLSNKTLVSPIISGLASVANASTSLLSVTGQFWAGGTGTTTITRAGWVSVGTSTPYAQLTVWGNSTTTGRSFEVTDSASTTLFSIDNSGTTTIANLVTGAVSFEQDPGIISWIDLPSATNTPDILNGYVAQMNGNEMFGIYASTTGSVGVTNAYKVIIGTTTPGYLGLNNGSTTALMVTNGSLCVDNGTGPCAAGLAAGTIFSVTAATTGADLAEKYPSDDPTLLPGELLAYSDTSPVFVKRASERDSVIGIVSTAPGSILGSGVQRYGATTTVAVALAGRVPTKVNLEGGPIVIGDHITISSVAGVGMKATTSGQVVGIALESFDGNTTNENGDTVYSQTGEITVFVNLGYQKLDDSIEGGEIASGWAIDQETGFMKLATSTSLDLAGNDLVNVRAILSKDGAWSIDETGKLVVDSIEAKSSIKLGSPEHPIGITLFDQQTGAPYCLSVSGGMTLTREGQCSYDTGANMANVFNGTPTSASTPEVVASSTTIEEQATSTPVASETQTVIETATTTELVVEPTTEPVVEPILEPEPAPIASETATSTP